MEPEVSKISSMFSCSCPRCRKGKMFKHSMFHPTKFYVPQDDCAHCGLHYEVEPGLFWGAMYVSYSFAVATIVSIWLFMNFILGVQNLAYYIFIICSALVLSAPASFRYSRMFMLYWFSGIEYQPNYQHTK